MSPTPGYVFKDSGLTPEVEKSDGMAAQAQNKQTAASPTAHSSPSAPKTQSTSTTKPNKSNKSPIESKPTDSHALAHADHELQGAAQEIHDETEVRDLGWSKHPKNVPAPLVGGLPNEQLWTLVRRFNKQMYHVKALPEAPLAGLDMEIADEDEFSPDKLRSTLERLYMTVIIGVIGFGKHIVRLRSWREPRRTSGFCAVYFIAWFFNMLVPTLLTLIITLIVYPPSRSFLFPPAPLALVSGKTGGVKSPSAGVLGSHDSVTGAPEKHQGEAVEQEASNFVAGMASIAVSSAVGQHDQATTETDPLDDKVPDPTNIVAHGSDAQTSAAGGVANEKRDKTKKPMEEAMWTQIRPIMHAIGDLADVWERFGNALSPTPPYPRDKYRLKLASIFAPLLLVSLFVTSSMVMKGTTFGIGAGFFSDPLLWRGLDLLNRKVPNWQKYLELRNTLLKGVPTNAQLTITLLRIGEANSAPLPPPPQSNSAPPSRPASLNHEDLADLDATNSEIDEAIHKDEDSSTDETHDDASGSPKQKKKASTRIVNFFKGTTSAGVNTKLSVDEVRARVGSKHAKQHLGILPKKNLPRDSGPIEFKCRFNGKKGAVYLSTSPDPAVILFHPQTAASDAIDEEAHGGQGMLDVRKDPKWEIPVREIRELKKIGGLGWKGKIVVGWATEKQVKDGLEVVGKDGKTVRVTAVELRDELFNRLVAMGGQVWQSY